MGGLEAEGGEPLFPYPASVEEAVSTWGEASAELGFARPGRPGKPLRALVLGAVEHVWEESGDFGEGVLAEFHPHVRLSCLAALGEDALEVVGGRLREARAKDGSSLLLEGGRVLGDPQLLGERDRVSFQILTRPASRIAEVSGYLDYLLPSEKVQTLELVFAELAAEAKDKGARARISELRLARGGLLELTLVISRLDEGRVQRVELVGAAAPIVAELQSESSVADELEEDGEEEEGVALSLRFPGLNAVPPGARIRLTLRGAPTRHRVAFKLKGLELTGEAR